MKNFIQLITCVAISICCVSTQTTIGDPTIVKDDIRIDKLKNEKNMKLGAFSISLNVKDLATSKEFYEKLGFVVFAGDMKMNYLIMKNEQTLIGLFQGMFEDNPLTFNPGWDQEAKNVESFDDVRVIQKSLKEQGIDVGEEIDQTTSGPAFFTITDPDGNRILIDQHR